MADLQDVGSSTNRLQYVSLISTGERCSIFLARRPGHGAQTVAVKVYPRDRASSPQRDALRVLRERHSLERVTRDAHPFIVSYRFAYMDDRRLFLGMDLCGGGDLYSVLQSRGPLSPSNARCYAGELCLALGHVHSFGFAHRDLKPENVLVAIDGHVKLADFSSCKRVRGPALPAPVTHSLCGTPEYLAPEVVVAQPSCETADWWSFACVLCEMLCSYSPFAATGDSHPDIERLLAKILNAEIALPCHPHIGPAETAFLLELLEREPDKRLGRRPYGHTQVLGHAWFDGVQADALLHKQVPPPWSPLGPLPPTAAPFTVAVLAIATGQATIGQATDLYLVPDTFIEEHILASANPFEGWGAHVRLT